MTSVDSAAIEARATAIFAAHQITQDDRAFLMSVFKSERIDHASEALINKIYEALSDGKIRVVA